MCWISSRMKEWLRTLRRRREERDYVGSKQGHIAQDIAQWKDMGDNGREWVRWEDSGLNRFLPKEEIQALIDRRELSGQLFRQSDDELLMHKTVYLVDAAALVISDGKEYPWKDVWVCLLEGQPIWKTMDTVKDTLNYGDSGFDDF